MLCQGSLFWVLCLEDHKAMAPHRGQRLREHLHLPPRSALIAALRAIRAPSRHMAQGPPEHTSGEQPSVPVAAAPR